MLIDRAMWRFPSLALVKGELLATMRQVRPFIIMALVVAACIVMAVGGWPQGRNALLDAASFSRQFVHTMMYMLLVACIVFVPALAANSITIERERQTFDLLQLTLIRRSGIVFAKLVNSVGFFVFLIIAALPVLGAAFFLVGLEWAEWGRLVAVILLTAVTCALIGITISARSRKGFKAIAGSYLFILLFMGVGPIIVFFLWAMIAAAFGDIRSVGTTILPSARVGSPIATISAIQSGALLPREFVYALAYQGGLAAFCFFLAVRSFRHIPRPPAFEQSKPIDDPGALRARRLRFPFYLIDPLKRKKAIEDGRNPMMVKEMRWGLMNRATVLVRVFYIAMIIYFVLGMGVFLSGGRYDNMYFWIMSQIVVTVTFAPALLANAMTKERELGNMDMLRLTLLTPRQIVLGKLMAGAISVSPLLFAAILSATISVLVLGLRQWGLMATGYTTLFLSTALCLSLSLASSLIARRTTTALVLSYVFALFLFVGFPVIGRILWLQALRYLGGQPIYQIDTISSAVSMFLSPVFAFIHNAHSTEHSAFASRTAPHASQLAHFSLYWVCNIAVFGVVCGGLVVWSIRLFKRRHLRDV